MTARLIILLLFSLNNIVAAQSFFVDKKKFFTDEQLIEMTLETDFKKLEKEKVKPVAEPAFQPANLTCIFPDRPSVTEKN